MTIFRLGIYVHGYGHWSAHLKGPERSSIWPTMRRETWILLSISKYHETNETLCQISSVELRLRAKINLAGRRCVKDDMIGIYDI